MYRFIWCEQIAHSKSHNSIICIAPGPEYKIMEHSRIAAIYLIYTNSPIGHFDINGNYV